MKQPTTFLKKILLLCTLLMGLNQFGYAQAPPTLRGLLDAQLFTIDTATAFLSNPLDIPFNGDNDFRCLTYAPDLCVYFGLINPNTQPTLVQIDLTGAATVIGPFTLAGENLPLVESLAYDGLTGRLYAGVSRNGGVMDDDFFSETLVTVDPVDASCTVVIELSNIYPRPDADALAAHDDVVFYLDGGDPAGGLDTAFTRLYALDFRLADTLIQNPLIDSAQYERIRDLSILQDTLYGISDSTLFKIDWPNGAYAVVGITHEPDVFDGATLQGLATQSSGQNLTLEFGGVDTLCTDSVLVINIGDQTMADSIVWSDGTIGPEIVITEPGDYTLTAFADGCSQVSNTLTVIGSDCEDFCDYAIPNAFTPNRDGTNDAFKVIFTCEREGEVETKVFNRWGKVVYEANNNQGWDGDYESEPAPSDVYYYFIRVRVENEGEITEEMRQGEVTLVR